MFSKIADFGEYIVLEVVTSHLEANVQINVFSIPAVGEDPDDECEKLNAFLRGHWILSIKREIAIASKPPVISINGIRFWANSPFWVGLDAEKSFLCEYFDKKVCRCVRKNAFYSLYGREE